MANNQANSGSDLIPVTYVQTAVATSYFWGEPHDTRMPENYSHPVVTPTWAGYQVTGPSPEIIRQIAAGTIQMKVTVTNVRMSGAPAFIAVIVNGINWTIQAAVPVIVPQVVYDTINNQTNYAAVIV